MLPAAPVITMTSLELLEVVNAAREEFGELPVRRNDFTARCRDELAGENYEIFVVPNPNGTQSDALRLTRDQCMYILMRESKAVRRSATAKLNQREQLPNIPRTYAEALRLAADQAERIEQQAAQLEQQRPAVEFVDRFVEAKSAKGLREVSKILGIKEREFIGWLRDDGVIFKQGNHWLPKAAYQHAGYFEVKTGEASGHAYHQTRFTPAGIAWIAERVAKRAAVTEAA